MAEELLALATDVVEIMDHFTQRLSPQRRGFFLTWLQDHLRMQVDIDEPLKDRLLAHLIDMPMEQLLREGIVILREVCWCESFEMWRLDELQNLR
jgi:hypothetical protein